MDPSGSLIMRVGSQDFLLGAFELLPQSQRTKDHLFHAIVRAFRTASPAAPEG